MGSAREDLAPVLKKLHGEFKEYSEKTIPTLTKLGKRNLMACRQLMAYDLKPYLNDPRFLNFIFDIFPEEMKKDFQNDLFTGSGVKGYMLHNEKPEEILLIKAIREHPESAMILINLCSDEQLKGKKFYFKLNTFVNRPSILDIAVAAWVDSLTTSNRERQGLQREIVICILKILKETVNEEELFGLMFDASYHIEDKSRDALKRNEPKEAKVYTKFLGTYNTEILAVYAKDQYSEYLDRHPEYRAKYPPVSPPLSLEDKAAAVRLRGAGHFGAGAGEKKRAASGAGEKPHAAPRASVKGSRSDI